MKKRVGPFEPGYILIPLVVLTLSSLACNVPAGVAPPTPTSPPPPPTASPTPVPTSPPTPTLVPTATTPPVEVQPTSAPAGVLVPENVAGLTDLLSGQADDVQLHAAAFSPISYDLATFGLDAIVRIWDLESGDLLYELPGHTAAGWALSYSPNGQLLASGGNDYRVRIWDPLRGELLYTVIVNAQPYRVIWSHDSSVFGVVGEGSNRIELFDAATGQKITDLQPGEFVLWSAAFAPDSSLIATADNRGVVSVYDINTLNLIGQDSSTATGAAWDLEFSPDGALLASCNDRGGVYIWAVANMEPVLWGDVYEGDCVDGMFSLDGRLYFSAGDDGTIYAWDTSSGSEVGAFNMGLRIWTISLSYDGMYIAVAMDDGSLHVLGLP